MLPNMGWQNILREHSYEYDYESKPQGDFEMRKMTLFALMALFSLAGGQTMAQSLSLDHVDGLNATDGLQMGVPVVFYIRVTGDASNHDGITNGFRVYSPSGSQWGTTVPDTTGTLGKAQFDGGFIVSTFSATGSDADTVGFSGFRFFQAGIPAGFDDIAYTITIGPIDASYEGGTICLDSSFYLPSGVWKWAGPEAFPDWDGPHCYPIGEASTQPEITCPGDTAFFACEPDTVCFPFAVTNAETVTATNAYISGETVCVPVLSGGVINVIMTAVGSGGVDQCQFTVTAALNTPPTVTAQSNVSVVQCTVGEEICIPYIATDIDYNLMEVITNLGTLEGGNVCFQPPAAGNYNITLTATDGCGASAQANISVEVIAGEAATITCPDNQVVEICEPELFCVPIGFSPDTATVTITSGPGYIEGNQYCVAITATGNFEVGLQATTQCGQEICDFTIDATVIGYPQITCPVGTIDVIIDGPGQACVGLPITNADNVSTDLGSWAADELCFQADVSGEYVINVTATNTCGSDECQVVVNVLTEIPEFNAMVEPGLIHVYDGYTIIPRKAHFYIGNLPEGLSVADIDTTSLMINGVLVPDSFEVLAEYPGFAGEVLKCRTGLYSFMSYYEPLYDTILTTFAVTGQFNDQSPLNVLGEVTFTGLLVGDLNLDGQIDISDLLFIIDYFFLEGPAPLYEYSADFNKDASVDISDLMALVDYMFGQ